jgi:hypothetical protein
MFHGRHKWLIMYEVQETLTKLPDTRGQESIDESRKINPQSLGFRRRISYL